MLEFIVKWIDIGTVLTDNYQVMKKLSFCFFVVLVLALAVSAWELQAGDRKINLFNYLQVRYTAGPASTDQFSIPRLRTDLWGDLGERLGYFIEYDYVTSPSLIYCWLDIKTDLTKISLGRFYVPFGLEYMTPPSRFDLIDPTNALWYYFGYSRDTGIEVSKKYDSWKYYLALINGADNQNSDDNEAKDVTGRIVFTPQEGVAFGFSGYSGRSGSAEAEKSIAGIELDIKQGALRIKGEGFLGRMNGRDNGGYYLQPMIGEEGKGQVILRYEYWDPNSGQAGSQLCTTTLGLNYWWEKELKVQANYEHKFEAANPVQNDVMLLQLQLNF